MANIFEMEKIIIDKEKGNLLLSCGCLLFFSSSEIELLDVGIKVVF